MRTGGDFLADFKKEHNRFLIGSLFIFEQGKKATRRSEGKRNRYAIVKRFKRGRREREGTVEFVVWVR